MHDLGHVDERVVAVRVGEELLVAGLVLVVELLDDPGADLVDQRAGSKPENASPMAPNTSPAASRSASMAWSTPGYWTFTATARPSWVMARWTWPIDADASGTGSHSAKAMSGGAPSCSLDDARRQLGRHGRGVLLQLGQGRLGRGRAGRRRGTTPSGRAS